MLMQVLSTCTTWLNTVAGEWCPDGRAAAALLLRITHENCGAQEIFRRRDSLSRSKRVGHLQPNGRRHAEHPAPPRITWPQGTTQRPPDPLLLHFAAMATACAAPSAVVRQQPVAHRPVSAPGAPAAAFVSQGAYKYKGRVWAAARGGVHNQGRQDNTCSLASPCRPAPWPPCGPDSGCRAAAAPAAAELPPPDHRRRCHARG